MTTLHLASAERDILLGAIDAVLAEIEEWEFGLRLVVEREEGLQVRERLVLAPVEAADVIECRLSSDELAFLRATLNEVLRGFAPPNFSDIGDRAEVEALGERLWMVSTD